MPSASCGRGQSQHGGAPNNHKSVLNRPGFKFNESPGPEVGTSFFILPYSYCSRHSRCALFVNIEYNRLYVMTL